MSKADMAKRLRTPYRTYVNWERGERPISGLAEVAVELLLKHDRMVMEAIKAKVVNSFPGTGTR